ncbi:MAG: SDR family NAD(P)-dependent oxidoreductase [Gammaproteobacteria bacterium]|jgi:retinol dehydrogenase-12
MTPLSGKLCLVTGATDGIGKALARRLLQAGAGVILHGRNAEKMAATVAELDQYGEVYPLRADFSSLDEVRNLADIIAAQFGQLDVLVNNAGLLTDKRQLSQDGFELTFAVNYLAPWVLTNLLLGPLANSKHARIVNVASTALGGGHIDLDNLQSAAAFSGWQAYANSKLANLLFSNLLAEKLSGTGTISNALCPGLIDTNFFHTNTIFADGAYERMRPGMRSPDEGADIPFYVAAAPEIEGLTGRFFLRGRGYYKGSGFPMLDIQWDRELAVLLWLASADLVQPWINSDKA